MLKNKTSFVLRIIALLFCALFICSRMITESLAKYTTSASSYDSMRVAKFIDVNNDVTEDGTIFNNVLTIKPSYDKTSSFVFNNSGETTVKVYLEVISSNNLPLEYFFNSTSTTTYEFTMTPGELGKNVDFRIFWDSSLNDYEYSNVAESIMIKATYTQVE